jgi:RNA polymerase sigma-70 factor, ECF subfamily
MLQTVLGIDAARIASAFLVSPTAMSQRLIRAKNKIRAAAIPFRVPNPQEWNERISFVLDAIYSAYTTGWESLIEVSSTHHALAGDAIAIGRTLARRPNCGLPAILGRTRASAAIARPEKPSAESIQSCREPD